MVERSPTLESRKGVLGTLVRVVVRSLFPITAVLIILGTVVWGPYVTPIVAYGWWKIVGRIG